MIVDFEEIRDKQRIIIIGNEGTSEITRIAIHVLQSIEKPADFIFANGEKQLTNAPIVLIQGDDKKNSQQSEADFLSYKHHIALFHHIMDTSVPEEYSSLEDYVAQYEKLAKITPKGGSIFYNKEDDLTTVIGSQDYEDVRLTEYESLPLGKANNGFTLPGGEIVETADVYFPVHAAAAKVLLERISVREEEFYNGLTTYKD